MFKWSSGGAWRGGCGRRATRANGGSGHGLENYVLFVKFVKSGSWPFPCPTRNENVWGKNVRGRLSRAKCNMSDTCLGVCAGPNLKAGRWGNALRE